MRPLLPAAALCLVTAIIAAPSATAATAYWSNSDACESTVSAVTVTWCTVSGTMSGQVDTPSTTCSKSGSTYIYCNLYLFCSNTFSNVVPVHYSASCTGFGSESCDVLERGSWSGCTNTSDGTGYMANVFAGSCATYTLSATVTPMVSALPPAHISHSITLCVSSSSPPTLT